MSSMNKPLETAMSTISSAESFTISTFTSPRAAPPPRIIPLIATTVHRHYPKLAAIHENLQSKPFYHPYAQMKRSSAAAATSSPEPDSPLTPSPDESFSENSGHPQPEPQPILIPPPQGTLSVASLNLHQSLAKDYRAIAKAAIIAHGMDINRALSEQDSKSRDEARAQVEGRILQLGQHKDHWGADILLRDQLKSMRDVTNKKGKKKQVP